ncbi:DnaJ domain containing protein [Lotmaria passim]
MKHLLQCHTGTRPSPLAAFSLHSLLLPRRYCATTPTEDDVLKAYKTLGVHAAASLADVKKRYGDLAKEHHPDVSTSTTASSTSRMTDINAAYNTVKQFYQSGGRLSSRASPSSSSSAPGGAGGPSSSYYTKYDSAYQPWYEDMDPLMYELMWEEMRRQNEEEAFANTAHPDNFHRMGGQWRPPRGSFANGRSNNVNGNRQRSSSHGNSGSDKGNAQHSNSNSKASVKTTTWPEEQVKAMINMYQDGKSFEFIANALGKKDAAAVMEEFNRYSADSQSNRRRGNYSGNHSRQGNNGRRRRRQPSNRPFDFYYAESPDDIPYELYEMMEEEPYYDGAGADTGNPFGYYTGETEAYDAPYGNATPFYGTHQMSGGVPPFPHSPYANGNGGGRVYNSARNAPYKPSRHHRGGVPHKSKRNNTNNCNGGSGNNGGAS